MLITAAFENLLDQLSARRTDRELGKTFVQKHPQLIPIMVSYSLKNNSAQRQVMSAWIMECYFMDNLLELTTYVPIILNKIASIKNESVRRSLSKLLFYFCKNPSANLTKKQNELLVSIAFDWLIFPAKVATQSFAIKILIQLQNHATWILPELKAVIKKQLPTASPGFKAAARELLL